MMVAVGVGIIDNWPEGQERDQPLLVRMLPFLSKVSLMMIRLTRFGFRPEIMLVCMKVLGTNH